MVTKSSISKGVSPVDVQELRKNISNLPPALRSTVRNFTESPAPVSGKKDEETVHIDEYKLERVSNIISNNINSTNDLRLITPYIDKAALIWKTILLRPNGKQDKYLTYDTLPNRFKNTKLYAALTNVWSSYYTNDYKIEDELDEIVDRVLITSGSYIWLNISRPALDNLINGAELDPDKPKIAGTESFNKTAANLIENSFTIVDGKVRVRNKGAFVKSKVKASNNLNNISGLEQLFFSDADPDKGVEFNIFEDDDEEINSLKDLIDITITDNPDILYLQEISEINKTTRTEIVTGNESFADNLILGKLDARRKEETDPSVHDDPKKKPSKGRHSPEEPIATTMHLTGRQYKEVIDDLVPERNPGSRRIQFLRSPDSLSVSPFGESITSVLSSDSTIVITYSGARGTRTDYIVLMDEEGGFLRRVDDYSFFSKQSSRATIANKPTPGSTNSMIESLRKIQEGVACDFDMSEFAELAKGMLIKRFMSSIISNKGESISITMDQEVNKIFLSHMFRKQGVRCLYVPGESLTYCAINTDSMGLGQSLIHNAKAHITRLAAMDLADALANIEGAQPHTEIEFIAKENDPDPYNSMNTARNKYFRNNPRIHDILSSNSFTLPAIVDALRESTVTVKMKAENNPRVTDVEINTQRVERDNFKPVDDASRNYQLNQISNYLHLPRSWMDVSDDANDFKIEAVTENQMVYNRGLGWQEKICDSIIDFERKKARSSGYLISRLVDCIVDNKSDWAPDSKEKLPFTDDERNVKFILTQFMNSIYCSLPTPNSIERTDKIIQQIEAVTKLVDSWLEMSNIKNNYERFSKVLGIEDGSMDKEAVISTVRSYFIQMAFKRYNLPNVLEETLTEDGLGGLKAITESIAVKHLESGNFLAEFFVSTLTSDKKLMKAYKNKLEKALKDVEPGDDEGESTPDPENTDTLDDDTNPSDGGGAPQISEEPPEEEEEVIDPEDDETPPEEEDNDKSESEEEEPKPDEPGGKDHNPFG